MKVESGADIFMIWMNLTARMGIALDALRRMLGVALSVKNDTGWIIW